MALQRSLYRLAFWCRWLLCRDQLERELDDEISYHVQANTEENIAKGMTPQQARRAARLELGGVEQIRERVRAARRGCCDGKSTRLNSSHAANSHARVCSLQQPAPTAATAAGCHHRAPLS